MNYQTKHNKNNRLYLVIIQWVSTPFTVENLIALHRLQIGYELIDLYIKLFQTK